jgi:hypothetical protein
MSSLRFDLDNIGGEGDDDRGGLVEHRGGRATRCDDRPPHCRSVDYCRRQPKLAAIGDDGKTRRRRCYGGSQATSDGAKPSG